MTIKQYLQNSFTGSNSLNLYHVIKAPSVVQNYCQTYLSNTYTI